MWSCGVCTLENQPSATECEGCNIPRNATAEGDSAWWQCQVCCQVNLEGMHRCNVCNNKKNAKPALLTETETQAGAKEEIKGANVQQKPEEADDKPIGAEAAPPCSEREAVIRATDDWWLCQSFDGVLTCNTSNLSEDFHCSRCNRTKPYLRHQLRDPVSQMTGSIASIELDPGDEVSRYNDAFKSDFGCPPWSPQQPAISAAGDRTGLAARSSSPSWQQPIKTSVQVTDREDIFQEEEPLDVHRTEPLDVVRAEPLDAPCAERLDFPDQECRLVLIGKTGNGKSSVGNTLLGFQRFDCSMNFNSVTRKCQRHNVERFGIRLEVMDTPGLFDTTLEKDAIIKEVVKCLGVLAPGPHAILLVLRIGVRFTEEENKAVEEVFKLFGVHLLRFLVIVFTHGDQLKGFSEDQKERKLKDLLEGSPKEMKDLLERANHRYVVFDNTAQAAEKDCQVRQLLVTIRNLMKVNGGGVFTSDAMRIVERCMKDREDELVVEVTGRRPRKGARQSQMDGDTYTGASGTGTNTTNGGIKTDTPALSDRTLRENIKLNYQEEEDAKCNDLDETVIYHYEVPNIAEDVFFLPQEAYGPGGKNSSSMSSQKTHDVATVSQGKCKARVTRKAQEDSKQGNGQLWEEYLKTVNRKHVAETKKHLLEIALLKEKLKAQNVTEDKIDAILSEMD